MSYYDFTNKVHVNITFKGFENKNKNNLSPDNVIFVFDMAYYSEDFINYLDSNKYNHVIGAKKSSLYVNIKENKEKIKKKKKINNENVRFVKHEHKYKSNVRTRKKETVQIEKTCTRFLVTNLNNDYSDDKIKEIYINRWTVEIFF